MGSPMEGSIVPCRECPLRSLRTFAPVSDRELAFIQTFKQQELDVRAGGAIIPEAGRSGQLYTVLFGMAFRYQTLSDGRRQILNFLFPGDLVGLQEQVTVESPHGVEALTETKLCVFPMERLWDLYRSFPQLGYDITWLTAHEEYVVDGNLLTVGRRSASERIAMLLIHIVKRAEAIGWNVDGTVPLPMTQQHIADALGLSLVHTNKTLRRLEKLGLHKLENNRLRLLKPTVLKRMADYYAVPLR